MPSTKSLHHNHTLTPASIPAQAWKLSMPDDFHLHLRDGALLAYTAPLTAWQFGRALIMPNLTPPITTVAAALAYRKRILAALKNPAPTLRHPPTCPPLPQASLQALYQNFNPLMSLYLQEKTPLQELHAAAHCEHILGCKYYPAGVTTHSEQGIRSLAGVSPALATMEKLGIPLMIHGESPDPQVDVFEREQHFIDNVLTVLIKRFPALTITLEHISTRYAVQFILAAPPHVKATITLHHLLLTRNDLLATQLNPHYYCKPLVKHATDRTALQQAALGRLEQNSANMESTSTGGGKFFFGSDSAPHSQFAKESACGCAGIFSAPFALASLAQLFSQENAHDHLQAFSCENGARHYNLKISKPTLVLLPQKPTATSTFSPPEPINLPHAYPTPAQGTFIPFQPYKKFAWKVAPII